MHVCFICMEIFAWGKYGGYGRATRLIGRELVKRGIRVTAIVPLHNSQGPRESLDGMDVLGFKPLDLLNVFTLYRLVDADIYHSEEPSMGTFIALRAVPHRKHVVTFQNPRTFLDWIYFVKYPTKNTFRVLGNWVYEDNPLVGWAVRQSDAQFAVAQVIMQKAKNKYRLKSLPGFLPNPVEIPPRIDKAKVPTVCFVSRLDRIKRPEVFLELARQFPRVRFLVIGKSHDKNYQETLLRKYGGLENVEFLGFIDQFQSGLLSELISKSWILVNTSAREGLPNSFMEACAHQCAILSSVNPDDFASRFGYWARRGDFAHGLEYLLENNRWRFLGEAGFEFVKENYSLTKIIDEHLKIYESTCKS